MFNALFAFFGHANQMSTAICSVSDIIRTIENEYQKDGNAKDAAIDAICQILQAHKSTAKQQPK